MATVTAEKHVSYLESKGMKVNLDKTEIMRLGKGKPPCDTMTVNGSTFPFKQTIKALGIYMSNDLSWDAHLVAQIKKGKNLMRGFKFIRKYLNEKQFLTTVTNTFFASMFYGASVWYSSCKKRYLNKVKALYFRLLRTACNDRNKTIPKLDLIKRCNRATPCEWAKYLTASRVMKIIRDKNPSVLHLKIMQNYYEVPRKLNAGRFFDNSTSVVGKQNLANRLDFFKDFSQPWNMDKSDAEIRIFLKEQLFFYCK